MQLKPTITIRDFPHSATLEAKILSKIAKLNTYYQRIMHCDVMIEQYQKHKHQGKLYNVRVALTVPDKELIASRPKRENVHVAIRDAFKAITRQLQDYADRRRGHVKNHELLQSGVITRLFSQEGFGFIASNEDEYYFSFSNVNYPEFEKLEAGMVVHFLPTFGEDGLQANRVTTSKEYAVSG